MASETPFRLEVRLPGSRPSIHEISAAEFLIGSVAGCDLVIPGPDLPPVIGVIARAEDGHRLRKLAPNLKLLLNGQTVHHAPLNDGDIIGVGNAEMRVHIPAAVPADAPIVSVGAPAKPWSFTIPLGHSASSHANSGGSHPPVANSGGSHTPLANSGGSHTPLANSGGSHPPLANRPIDTSGAMRQLQQETERLKHQKLALAAEEQSRRATWAERDAQLGADFDAARDRKLAAAATPRTAPPQQLDRDRAALDTAIREHREDLARLDRNKAQCDAREAELAKREQAFAKQAPMVEERLRELQAQEARLGQQAQQIQTEQADLTTLSAQLDQRSTEVEKKEVIAKALEHRLERVREELALEGNRLTEQKAGQDALDRELYIKEQQLAGRYSELALREETANRLLQQLDEREAHIRQSEEQAEMIRQQLAGRESNLKNAENQMQVARAALDSALKDHREDLVRLDRYRGEVEGREKQVAEQIAELDRKLARLQDEQRRLESISQDHRATEARLADEHTRIQALKNELDANTTALAQKSATAEGQQAVVLAVRAKLERLREELRTEAQALADQRAKLTALEHDLTERQKQMESQSAELEAATLNRTKDQATMAEHRAMIETAFAEMKSLKAKLTAEEQALQARAAELESRGSEHVNQAGELRTKAAQLLDIQQKIDADRQALLDREKALREAELARTELQEQLLRRSEELTDRQRVTDRLAAEIADRAEELARDRARVDADLQTTRADLDARVSELEQAAGQLHAREQQLLHRVGVLKDAGQKLAAERKNHAETQTKWQEEHRLAAEDLVRTRGELEAVRGEIHSHVNQVQTALPDLELRGGAALERLAQAREQLKHHVGELHEYAQQSHADLEALRNQVQAETERLREQQNALAKARGDHRHAVATFRQQLLDWQGRVAEMKQAMAQGGSPLHHQAMQLDIAANEIETAGAQLDHHAAQLQTHDEIVSQKGGEVVHHLSDMRDWFRHKLRELAESSAARHSLTVEDGTEATLILPSGLTGEVPATNDGQRTADDARIISITHDLDPGDRKLGELLHNMELVDDDTLTALLLEARRQRRSLRQVLLASGKLTVYQMALIEAGNVDGLTIGPMGVIDRLQVTPRESVYRVIDPRPGSKLGPLVLRHLADSEMADAVRPDEFRQRFTALAQLRHPHVAATIEVLTIQDRPAALQEWLSGLTSAEWPSLAASPGVWYRLTCQALLGLSTAHEAGLVHGGLNAKSVILSADGLVKLTGIGEPPWLNGSSPDATQADDLLALGQMAKAWAALTPKRKLSKSARPLPPLVRQTLDRWSAGQITSASDVLDALDSAGSDVPSGTESWERLMKYADENATEGVAWRKSA